MSHWRTCSRLLHVPPEDCSHVQSERGTQRIGHQILRGRKVPCGCLGCWRYHSCPCRCLVCQHQSQEKLIIWSGQHGKEASRAQRLKRSLLVDVKMEKRKNFKHCCDLMVKRTHTIMKLFTKFQAVALKKAILFV